MRLDAATILMGMGYVLDRDFVAVQDTRTSVRIDWLAAAPRPTDAEVDAAVPVVEAARAAEAAKQQESTTARDDAKRALSALDTIIGGIDAANLTQAKTAIKQLAQIQRHIILATLGR